MISVIMGVYNNEKTIKDAVMSILNGSYSDLEFIIVDDGSTDETYFILEDIAKIDNRVHLLKNETNSGLAFSLNKALKIAKGDYIARQDADDVSLPTRLEKELAFLKNNPSLDFCGTSANLITENGQIWGERIFPEEITEDILIKYCPFIHPTMLFTSKALKTVGGYTDTKHTIRCEDYDLYFKLYAAGFKGSNLNEKLLNYYESKNSFKRHTLHTRMNEAYVRRHGSKKTHKALKGFIYSFKPIILALVPKKLYNKLHNKKWENNN